MVFFIITTISTLMSMLYLLYIIYQHTNLHIINGNKQFIVSPAKNIDKEKKNTPDI